jgi:hypothetical protein
VSTPTKIDLATLEHRLQVDYDSRATVDEALALIARIRELEEALEMQCDRLDDFIQRAPSSMESTLQSTANKLVRAIISKGTVLM